MRKVFRAALAGLMLTLAGSASWVRASDNSASTPKMKSCFQCKGTGQSQCSRAGCQGGQVDCPGPCVKASGKWVRQPTPNHDPSTLWQWVKFTPRGGGYVSQGHVGEYFTVDASNKVTPHPCKTCGRTGRVKCPVCNGSPACQVCGGKKSVPESWSAFDHPKMKDRPSRFKLKDGREIVGRKRKVVDGAVTIRTATGDIQVESSQIVSEERQTTEEVRGTGSR